jgi:DNA-binding winged helix-turn-helix (wHTH) protein
MDDPCLQFGSFRFIPDTGELSSREAVIPLEPQPALVLAALLAAAGRPVTRRELAAAIWRDGTHVEFDDGLNYCIRQIRVALGDDPKAPRFVETLPRRGYRFIAPVTVRAGCQPLLQRHRLAAAAALVALVGLTVIVEARPNNHHEVAISILRTVHDLIY